MEYLVLEPLVARVKLKYCLLPHGSKDLIFLSLTNQEQFQLQSFQNLNSNTQNSALVSDPRSPQNGVLPLVVESAPHFPKSVATYSQQCYHLQLPHQGVGAKIWFVSSSYY